MNPTKHRKKKTTSYMSRAVYKYKYRLWFAMFIILVFSTFFEVKYIFPTFKLRVSLIFYLNFETG